MCCVLCVDDWDCVYWMCYDLVIGGGGMVCFGFGGFVIECCCYCCVVCVGGYIELVIV